MKIAIGIVATIVNVPQGLPLLIARDFVEVPITAELLDGRGIATETVRVAGLVPFLVLKALAYQDRFEQKDAYDIVYCLQYYGEGPDDAAALFADRMARWPDELLLPQALDILRDRFASDGSTEGHRKDGPVSYAGFLVDAGRTTLNMQRRRDAAAVVERFLQGFGGPGPSLPLQERSTERENAVQARGDGRILNFRVSSLGQFDATVEWGTNASMEVRVSLFRAGSNTPQQTTRITSVGLPGREQTVRFLNLDPGVSYRAVAQCEDDRQEVGFKTHEAWMR